MSFKTSVSTLTLIFLLELPSAAFAQTTTLPTTNVTASRTFDGIVGASTTVITAEDIARSPARTVQEILAQVPGVQVQTLYGAVNGAQTSVDVRGFGAFATPNTLVLLNGRRLNDVDLAGVDLSTIPLDSIERIVITKGNSGAVLYGDNAIGGVINIITKNGASVPATARIEGGVGSYGQREGSISASGSSGPWSSSVFANKITSDGYRENNALDQRNAVGDIRYSTPDFTGFFTVTGDDQRLGLPGARTVDPSAGINELATNRRGAATPFDHANKEGYSVTTGFTKKLWDGAELIVDGGFRDKQQQGSFFGTLPLSPFNATYVDAELKTWSLTPRLRIQSSLFGMSSNILTGIDYYDSTFSQGRSQEQGLPDYHKYNLAQQTLAGYWEHTLGILPSTDLSYGARLQWMNVTARDKLDPTAPGWFGDTEAAPLDHSEWNHALHLGLEHRFNNNFAVFGRVASAFRSPNVDERVSSGPSFDPNTFAALPRDFDIKTQTSNDIEGGFRYTAGGFALQSTVYNMNLKNEIHFDPVNFFDYNLDPTRRYGSETSATYRVNEALLLRGGFAYTRAIFREGPFTGNDVPLVSRYSASAGFSWDIWKKYLVLDTTFRYWSSRRMDNDQGNTQPTIPADSTIDLKLSGQYEEFFWSFAVNNVLNALYYDYAVASAFTPGRFNAYPLPGRTYILKAGINF